jgi:hypothetical protein
MDRTSTSTKARVAYRMVTLLIVVLVVTLLSTGAAAGRSHDRRHVMTAAEREAAITVAATQKKAVIVVGPVGSSTASYIARGRAIAQAAEEEGMQVVRLFHPEATWERVVAEANGADLFVYLGHGNGWPSPYGPFQEDTKNGLGLTPKLGTSDNVSTKYWGADHIREEIRFAPNAIVMFNGLCFASGNAIPGMAIPTRSVARQRIDNYAAGFLDAGARAVFALGWQPGATIVHSLFANSPNTMDGIFMTRFGGSVGPYYGWIGSNPDLYFASERVAGARLHMDPDPKAGYLRGLTGDLEMTTDEWLGTADPSDTVAPQLTELTAFQPDDTFPASDDGAPLFTPNKDGLSDTITLRHSLTEAAFLVVRVKKAGGAEVRRFTFWAEAGIGTFRWNGRTDEGKLVPEGRYIVEVTPRDRAGNVGDTASQAIRALTAIAAPRASAELFYGADGDALAALSTQSVKVTREATISWRIEDQDGMVVRHGITDQVVPAGPFSWDWDGTDDAGAPVADGTYTSIVTATTAAGTYSHELTIRQMSFDVAGDWQVVAGDRQLLVIESAEPLAGEPVVTVKQPGMDPYVLKVHRDSDTMFSAGWRARAGKAGKVTVTITGTDTDGGTQTRVYKGRIDR